jgi:hypothetical protein
LSDDQLRRLAGARRGGPRTVDEYLDGVRRWLATSPPRRQTGDYHVWAGSYNSELPEDAREIVSYSMLRKALPWSWDTIKAVAAGEIAVEDADERVRARRRVEHGPHDLISIGDIQARFGQGRTAARNMARRRGFPPPAYTHPRPPGVRLWRRADVEQFARGGLFQQGSPNELQVLYADASTVAAIYGLAVNTLRGGGGASVPRPAVVLAGLQLWLREDLRAP